MRLLFRQLQHSQRGWLELVKVLRELTPHGALPDESGHPCVQAGAVATRLGAPVIPSWPQTPDAAGLGVLGVR